MLQGAFTDQHFDQDLNFLATDEDPVSKKVCVLLIDCFPFSMDNTPLSCYNESVLLLNFYAVFAGNTETDSEYQAKRLWHINFGISW